MLKMVSEPGHQNLVSTTMLLMENMEGYGGETLGPAKACRCGFTAQGNFVGMPYKRTCFDKKLDWVFEGVHDRF